MKTGTVPFLAAASILMVGGCDFDLVAVDLTSPATFGIHMNVPECAGPVSLTAGFTPGLEGDGSIRPVKDENLLFEGEHVTASEVRSDGSRLYRFAEIPLTMTDLPLRFRLPTLEGGDSGGPPELQVEVLRGRAPETLHVQRDESIELSIVGTSHGSGGVEALHLIEDYMNVRWSLDVSADTVSGPIVSMRALELPPPVLQLPAAIFPVEVTEGWLEFEAVTQHLLSSADDVYRVYVQRNFNCTMPVLITN